MPIQEGGRFNPSDRIVSPGVFTRELDISNVAQGVADIGAAIVAPFPKGPGFAPTVVRSVAELEALFGVADGVYYGPYTAKEYLKEQGVATICRVGALTGYNQKNPIVVYAEPGYYTRLGSSGALVSGSAANLTSYLLLEDPATDTMLYATASNSHPNSGSLSLISASFIAKFQGDAADTTSPTSTSGSLLYSGRQFSFKFVSDSVSLSSLFVTSSYQGDATKTNEQKLLQSLAETTDTATLFSASLASAAIESTDADFFAGEEFTFMSASFKSVRVSGGCGTQIALSGVVSGSFGRINAFVSANTGGYGDPCNPTASSGRTPLVLAVLADTQHGSMNSSYEVAGFSGSVLTQSVDTSGVYSGSRNFESLSNYVLTLKSDGSTVGTYKFSLNPADAKYIKNVFGTNPKVGDPAKQVTGQKIEAAYLYNVFEDSIQKINDEFLAYSSGTNQGWEVRAVVSPSASFSIGDALKFTDEYSTNLNAGDSQFGLTNASTPWVYSQKVGEYEENGESKKTKFKLFKVHTLTDGTDANKSYKIEISNVKLAGTIPGSDYGSFTLSVRDYSDTDKKPKFLEIYQNLSLDPDSANFIARRIGDKYNYITYAGKIIEFGTYDNLSRLIRIEMTDTNYPEIAVPYGFQAYVTPIGSTLTGYVPAIKYSKASIYGLAPGKYASGTVFNEAPAGENDELSALYPTSSENAGVSNDTKQYFAPTPYYGSNDSNGANSDFDLEDTVLGVLESTGSLLDATLSGSVPSTYDAANEATYVKCRKFIFGFQGGFDGQWPAIAINVGSDITATNTQGLNCTNINSAGSIAYKQVIGALGNADEFDINLVATPGIFNQQHSYVTTLVTDMCETRGDCFYIMDNVVFPSTNQTVGMIDAAVSDVSTIDSSYVATYYPWVKIKDTNTNKIISVPPSVIIPAVYAANDRDGAEWFAPAGLNRGGIETAVGLLDRTTQPERDTLFEGRVNAIAAFPGLGISVWGQKTLQVEASALDRVNVRRLLINLKKFVASSSKYLLFEPNVSATRNRFLGIVNPYLESVQQRFGLYSFYVKMDDSNNTNDLIDRNILYGQVYIQPTKASEKIIIDFNILPTGGAIFSA